MAALQITVGGSAQNVTALHLIENEVLDAVTFSADTFSLTNKYSSLIETGPVFSASSGGGAGGTPASPESWE